MKNIYLVGFMGTGKSTLGSKLALDFGLDFADLDMLIEKEVSKTISDIFKEDGEGYFRELERNTLRSVSMKSNLIVACGGGIILDSGNISVMRDSGIAICLEADAEAIYERTRNKRNRPLLNVDNPLDRIKKILEERAPFYGKIKLRINNTGLTVEDTLGRLKRIIREAEYSGKI